MWSRTRVAPPAKSGPTRDDAGSPARFGERIDRINGRIRRGERLCRHDRSAYRRRNVIERCLSRLEQNRALATRYDERAAQYQAMVTLACLRLGSTTSPTRPSTDR
ncbi:hypothetical protein GCM10010393_27700 [Streptomyces gobitricini]|uniref:Transposase n=1 Tax=Streptomyces gobitricini TaxID=68211 RepID=A0ABN3M5Q4_9ACTN